MTKTSYKTISANSKTVNKEWVLVDAAELPLGRTASIVATLVRGKHKTNFTPHVDCGDNVVVINAEKVSLSGDKWSQKQYISHTGYPGGIKETNPEKMKAKEKSSDIIKLAIKRMIPSGPLGKKQLSNCKIYAGESHSHEAQQPKKIDFNRIKKFANKPKQMKNNTSKKLTKFELK